jgi:hypothetical protein
MQSWIQRALCAAGIVHCLTGMAMAADEAAPPKAAVAAFTYVDSSGEVRDQAATHTAMLKLFGEKLSADLAGTGSYRIVPLNCGENCPSADTNVAGLVDEARRAGADYVVFGGIHKMSTLVQWAKAVVIDVRTRQTVHDRLLTFRGDSEDAWRRAAAYTARELAANRAKP